MMIVDELSKTQRGYENARIIRSMIEQENNWQNYRLTWLMTIQGLLFAALGFAWDKADARGLVSIFSIVGIFVSISSWSVLRLSSAAYRDLSEWWEKHEPKDYDGPPVIGHKAGRRGLLWVMRPWRVLPWLFVLAWVSVLIFNLRRA